MGLGDVHTWTESFLNHDVISLIVGFPIWTVPRDFSGCFVGAKSICHHQIIVASKFQEPGASLIWFDVAVTPTRAFPVLIGIFSNLGIPVSLYHKDIFLGCFIQDFLQFFIEDLYILITVSWCWGVRLNDGDVEWLSPQSDGDEPIWDWATVYDAVHGVLVEKEPNTLLRYVVLATPE